MINLFDDEPQRFGEALGGTLWGGTLYELAPRQESPYHWQLGEEGEAGAHQVRNDADAVARIVFFSTCSDPEVVVYSG